MFGRARTRSRPGRVALGSVAVVLTGLAGLAAGCGSSGSGADRGTPTTAAPSTPASAFSVPARREVLTTDPSSPVVHDNEVMALAPHDGRLFAATDQWEYSGPDAYGQVLVKDGADAPWRVFEDTQSTRVQALDSFAIPADQGLGPGHSLLITQAIVDGRSEIQWLLDGANRFSPADSFALTPKTADVRSFGAHESGGTWTVFAGSAPTGILAGTWSPTAHTLVFDPTPELSAAPPGSAGAKTQKVTGFADCGGATWVTINTTLYRRNDGTLPAGDPRWVALYQEPPVGAFNSGLRGVSCTTYDGAPALLLSTEGSGNVYRLDHLPTGVLGPAAATPRPGVEPSGLVPTLEWQPAQAIAAMLAAQGTTVPSSGPGSIDYVIVAYNDFETVPLDGSTRQLAGLEWGYAGHCPATRTCAPSGFDAVACLTVRTQTGAAAPDYQLRCLTGPTLTPSAHQPSPVRQGQAFVSIRTIKASPFGDDRLYYGGYDNDFHAADGAAWIASSTPAALRLGPAGGASP